MEILALNELQVLSCDTQKAYTTAPCRDKVWTIHGKEFGSDSGKVMIIVRALYVTKNDGASFINFPVETLYDIGYSSST